MDILDAQLQELKPSEKDSAGRSYNKVGRNFLLFSIRCFVWLLWILPAVDRLTFGPLDVRIETELLIWFISQERIIVGKGATCTPIPTPQMTLIT